MRVIIAAAVRKTEEKDWPLIARSKDEGILK
jgi:hypothetical protein